MNIRLMEIRDFAACYDLWLRTPGMGLNSIDGSPEGIGRYLSRNPNTCFVAEEEGRIVGVILAGHDGRRGHISHTAVNGAFQRRGIGQQLVEYVMAAMGRRASSRSTWWCSPTTKKATPSGSRWALRCEPI